MKRLLLFVLLQTQVLVAQQSFELDAFGNYNSTGLRRQIPDAFFYGGAIDSSTIAKSLAKLGARNSFGLQMGSNAVWKSPWALSKETKKTASSYHWAFGAGIQQYSGLHFSKDAFGLVFQGGLPYLGDTLNLGNLRAESISFSKIGFGVVNSLTQSALLVHFVSVHNHIGASLQDGIWFQDPSSAQINLALEGSAQMSNAKGGFGFAIDLDYRFGSIQEEDQEQQFQLLIQNFGVARLSNMPTYALNGALQYQGFSLAEWQQTNLNDLAGNFLDTLGYQRSTTSNWVFLPTTVILAKRIDWESTARLQAYYGAQFILRQTYTPLIYTGAHVRISKVWHTGVGMAYGGFGGLRAQAYSAFHFKRSQLALRSDNIFMQNGASLYIQYRCDF